MSRTRTYEGRGTESDTLINLTNQGSVTTPNTKTPKGARKIDTVIASIGSDVAIAGRAGFLLRIGGDAVKHGDQTIVVGAEGYTAVQSGADTPGLAAEPFILEDADIEVDSSETLTIQAEMLDDDLGDVEAVVTLIFD